MARRIAQQGLRARTLVTVAIVTLAAGAVLSACGSNSAGALERQACTQVHQSLERFSKASSETGAAKAKDQRLALATLRTALGPAALAASESSDYQALAATLSETSRVSEAVLVPALSAQCAS